jgi:uridine kinase
MKQIENLMNNYEITIHTCLNENIETNKIYKSLVIQDKHDDSYRNSLNYSKKIMEGLKIIDNDYDIYMIVRSDLILNQINMNDIKDGLYFSNKSLNQFTNGDMVNDNIIITKNYELLYHLIHLYEYNLNNHNYLDNVLHNFLKDFSINYQLIDIDYKLIISNCNLIAIAGDSGSGKSSLSKYLSKLFGNDVITLETDRYHKWERGDTNYNTYSHLNPNANHLEKMYKDVYDLKIGNEVYQVDYDHTSGKFTQKEKIESKKNVIVCGLHTMYETTINTISDIKIYLDTDRELIKKWKIQRDVNERGYTLEKVLKQIEIREKDYEEYILKQKENADIVIQFYDTNSLKCKMIIQNEMINKKIINKCIEIKYNIEFDKHLIIHLHNNFYDEILKVLSFFIKSIE